MAERSIGSFLFISGWILAGISVVIGFVAFSIFATTVSYSPLWNVVLIFSIPGFILLVIGIIMMALEK